MEKQNGHTIAAELILRVSRNHHTFAASGSGRWGLPSCIRGLFDFQTIDWFVVLYTPKTRTYHALTFHSMRMTKPFSTFTVGLKPSCALQSQLYVLFVHDFFIVF